jgi:hypothetical protein
MADGAQAQGGEVVDPEGILRRSPEKIVFFERRVSQLVSELGAARSTAQGPRADAAEARRGEVEITPAMVAERGARGDAQARADHVVERVRLLEGERERLLSGLVERARVGCASGGDGAPARSAAPALAHAPAPAVLKRIRKAAPLAADAAGA